MSFTATAILTYLSYAQQFVNDQLFIKEVSAEESNPNQKCHKLWKKSKGGGVIAKIKKSTFQMLTNIDWEGGVAEFFRFFTNSNNWNMTLIFMIYGTDIGDIYATFGTYMAYMWINSPMYPFDMI